MPPFRILKLEIKCEKIINYLFVLTVEGHLFTTRVFFTRKYAFCHSLIHLLTTCVFFTLIHSLLVYFTH